MVPQWHLKSEALYIYLLLFLFSLCFPAISLLRVFFSDSMEKSTEGTKVDWMSVPAFGDWDKQNGGMPDYSLDFSKVRQMRKQNKSDYSRISIGNDDDLLRRSKKDDEFPNRSKAASAVSLSGAAVTPAIHRQHSPSGRKKIMSYFVCCIKA